MQGVSMQRALSAASRTPVSHCCVALVARKRLIDDLRWHDQKRKYVILKYQYRSIPTVVYIFDVYLR